MKKGKHLTLSAMDCASTFWYVIIYLAVSILQARKIEYFISQCELMVERIRV